MLRDAGGQRIAHGDLVADTRCDDELCGPDELFQVLWRVGAELELVVVEVPGGKSGFSDSGTVMMRDCGSGVRLEREGTYHKPGAIVMALISSYVNLTLIEEAAAVVLKVSDVVVCLPLALQGENHPPLTSAPTLVWPKSYCEVVFLCRR